MRRSRDSWGVCVSEAAAVGHHLLAVRHTAVSPFRRSACPTPARNPLAGRHAAPGS
jgi:hypothetical protein